MIDCRWLGRGGVGTVTRLLLDGLVELRPPGAWVLWGPADRLDPVVAQWPEARVVPTAHDPHALFGQRGFLREPGGQLIVSLHHMRPLRPRARLQLVHDTISIHVAPPYQRLLKHLFLRTVVRQSRLIMVPSAYTADVLVAELAVDRARLEILRYPIDPSFVARVRAARAVLTAPDGPPFIFALTRFGSHKNIEGLCDAFAVTAFAAAGGHLVVAGGSPDEVARVAAHVAERKVSGVHVRGSVKPAEVDQLFATAAALVLSSFEEGFGLSIWEARSVGLPAAGSDRGSLPEAGGEGMCRFDPHSTVSMAAAIDAVTSGGAGRMDVPSRPVPRDFAEQMVALVNQARGRPGSAAPWRRGRRGRRRSGAPAPPSAPAGS